MRWQRRRDSTDMSWTRRESMENEETSQATTQTCVYYWKELVSPSSSCDDSFGLSGKSVIAATAMIVTHAPSLKNEKYPVKSSVYVRIIKENLISSQIFHGLVCAQPGMPAFLNSSHCRCWLAWRIICSFNKSSAELCSLWNEWIFLLIDYRGLSRLPEQLPWQRRTFVCFFVSEKEVNISVERCCIFILLCHGKERDEWKINGRAKIEIEN